MGSQRRDRTSLESTQHSSHSRRSRRSSGSDRSEISYRSRSTVPTEYEYIDANHSYLHHSVIHDDVTFVWDESESPNRAESRTSVETYASTVASMESYPEALSGVDDADYYPEAGSYYDDTFPTTPADFGQLFPSTRKLSIKHDDSAPDGNMSLRVTTQIRTPKGKAQNMTLFYLRMYDLTSREFSLRRHDRNSGREVCHSVRQHRKMNEQRRPGFHRSISNAIASLRTRSDNRMPTLSTIARPGSRSPKNESFEVNDIDHGLQLAGHDIPSHPQKPTNTTRLEFSNYAQVEVKRRGAKPNKRYEFDYWGKTYHWKRVADTFQLVRAGGNETLANIIPEPRSPLERVEEQQKGGWVPPCAMWISDDSVIHMQNDLSDVIVASGLFALVDDCIKRRFHTSKSNASYGTPMTMTIPYSKHSSPKSLTSDMIPRRRPPNSHSHTAPHTSVRLRHMRHE